MEDMKKFKWSKAYETEEKRGTLTLYKVHKGIATTVFPEKMSCVIHVTHETSAKDCSHCVLYSAMYHQSLLGALQLSIGLLSNTSENCSWKENKKGPACHMPILWMATARDQG